VVVALFGGVPGAEIRDAGVHRQLTVRVRPGSDMRSVVAVVLQGEFVQQSMSAPQGIVRGDSGHVCRPAAHRLRSADRVRLRTGAGVEQSVCVDIHIGSGG